LTLSMKIKWLITKERHLVIESAMSQTQLWHQTLSETTEFQGASAFLHKNTGSEGHHFKILP
jgi:hypothetical protein